MCHTAYKSSLHDKVTKWSETLWLQRRNTSSVWRLILCSVDTDVFVEAQTEGLIKHHLWEWHYVAAHLFPAVAVISLQMPFDESMWRPCLTLQEGTASLHPILHHLQSVLIGCRAKRVRYFHGNQNTHYHELLTTKISVGANQRPTAFTDYHKAARIQSLQPITMETVRCM